MIATAAVSMAYVHVRPPEVSSTYRSARSCRGCPPCRAVPFWVDCATALVAAPYSRCDAVWEDVISTSICGVAHATRSLPRCPETSEDGSARCPTLRPVDTIRSRPSGLLAPSPSALGWVNGRALDFAAAAAPNGYTAAPPNNRARVLTRPVWLLSHPAQGGDS